MTKGGGRDFHGDVYEFFRDEGLDANSWSRNNSPLPEQNSRPAPFSFNQFGYDFGGPVYIPGKFNTNRDKLFFFWAQEWIRLRPRGDAHRAPCPPRAHAAGRLQRAARARPTRSSAGRCSVRDPLTGQPFPGNVIPADRLSPNGLALLNMYPLPTPGFQRGTNNWIGTSPNPRAHAQGHAAARLRAQRAATASRSAARSSTGRPWTRSATTSPLARTDWNRPNETAALSWTQHALAHRRSTRPPSACRATASSSRCSAAPTRFKRSKYGINYPYIFPGKEIEDKIPTISIGGFSTHRRRALSRLLGGPDLDLLEQPDLASRAATPSRPASSSSTRARTTSTRSTSAGQPGDTNNQNGRFEFTRRRARAAPASRSPTRPWASSPTTARSASARCTNWRALAVDAFVQDSWKARDNLTLEVRRPLRLLAALARPAQQHRDRSIRDFYDPSRAAVHRPQHGRHRWAATASTASCCRATASPPEASGQIEAAGNPRVPAALPRPAARASRRPTRTVFEPRLGAGLAAQRRRPCCGSAAASSTRASRSTTRRCSAATRRSSSRSA